MRSLIDFAIRHEYSRVKALGDPLCDIGSPIDWERFKFMGRDLYNNKTSRRGRPNIDIVIMVKLLVLQHWFGLSDPELVSMAVYKCPKMAVINYPPVNS